MINRKFMAIALPLVTFATLVGSGFSAWVFTETTVDARSATGEVIVTPLGDEGFGNISIDVDGSDATTGFTFKMILDQGVEDTKGDPDVGISFQNASNAVIHTLTTTYNISSTQITQLADSGLTPVFTSTLTVKNFDDYSTYIATTLDTKFACGSEKISSEQDSQTTSTQIFKYVHNVTAENPTTTFDFDAYSYTAAKPKSSSELTTMRNTMTTVTFEFNFSVDIVETSKLS